MFAARHRGWIGVDVGTCTVTVAQLVRRHDKLQIGAAVVVPRRSPWSTGDSLAEGTYSSADELRVATSLQPDFRGSRVAATLPMTLCDVHLVDNSIDVVTRRPGVIRQAIETAIQGSAEDLQFDCWSANTQESSSQGTQVLTLSKNWSDRLCEDIGQSGWECQVLDGMPQALARAVEMVEQPDWPKPIAVLDWGFGRATFCVVVEGRPVYVRSLKDCSFQRLLDAVSEQLNVTSGEVQQLLQNHGLSADGEQQTAGVAELVSELAAKPLAQLEQEIQRTIAHLEIQRKATVPQSICLMGGGGTIRGIAPLLAERLNLNVSLWEMPQQNDSAPLTSATPMCMLGPAAALSALAWEKS